MAIKRFVRSIPNFFLPLREVVDGYGSGKERLGSVSTQFEMQLRTLNRS